jgi:signal transduction histidine kinase
VPSANVRSSQGLASLFHEIRERFFGARLENRYFAYALVPALTGIALLARLSMAPVDAGLQYITFFPAVTLSVVIGGFWPGILATLLGAALATFVFTPPFYSFSREALQTSLWSNLVFLADGLIVCASVEAMHRFRERFVAELREAQLLAERVKAINKSLDEFTFIAAHDLKEPLRGIHSYASLLEEDCGAQLDDAGRQYVASLKRLAKRLSALIDDLMVYSRLDETKWADVPVDADRVLDAVVKDLERTWAEQGVELRRKGPLGTIHGDAGRLGEVLQNLLSNATKYNDKGAKWVEVGREERDGRTVFYVRDNGIGIPEEHRESVFRIFKRLHEQNKYGGGTGAGLTIVKKIVERWGGTIWLESTVGEGTTFYFTADNTQ